MPPTRCYEHLSQDADGVVWVDTTPWKVVDLVAQIQAHGWSPAEAHVQHPALSLGQIHAALAYYWDHAEALDADLQARLAQVARLEAATSPHPLRHRLRPVV